MTASPICSIVRLQVWVLLVGKRHSRGFGHFFLVLVEQLLVDLDLGWCKSWSSDEFKLRVADQFAGQPQERLLEVVVRLGRDVVVLEVLLAVECDGLGLDLALLHVDLVSAENDGDVFADSDEIT